LANKDNKNPTTFTFGIRAQKQQTHKDYLALTHLMDMFLHFIIAGLFLTFSGIAILTMFLKQHDVRFYSYWPHDIFMVLLFYHKTNSKMAMTK
jgi:hypothetical protein